MIWFIFLFDIELSENFFIGYFKRKIIGYEFFFFCSDVGNIIKEMYGDEFFFIIFVGYR